MIRVQQQIYQTIVNIKGKWVGRKSFNNKNGFLLCFSSYMHLKEAPPVTDDPGCLPVIPADHLITSSSLGQEQRFHIWLPVRLKTPPHPATALHPTELSGS